MMDALYAGNVGSLLNYSVEALERAGKDKEESGVSGESVAAISQTMDSLATYELGTKGYAASSAHMKPTAVAIKISGLVTDPYIFKRASENLQANGLSPFRLDGSPFPTLSHGSPDPLSRSDHLTLDQLVDSLRSICQKAKSADIVVMMDAEYSWFQVNVKMSLSFFILGKSESLMKILNPTISRSRAASTRPDHDLPVC